MKISSKLEEKYGSYIFWKFDILLNWPLFQLYNYTTKITNQGDMKLCSLVENLSGHSHKKFQVTNFCIC